MRTKLRSRISLLFMALALMLAIPATAALAAELVTAELAGAQNKVTVEQGKSANFDINLKGEGAMSCEITQAKPSTAKVINSYSITKASAANSDSTKRVLAGSTYSAAQNFWNDGSECSKTNNSPITWTGAPNGYNVPASISVASDVPVGTYTIGLSPANSTTQISNPTVSKGAILEDKQVTTLTFEVVAPPPPADSTPPGITPNIQGLLGDNGWYTSDVLLSWTVVDNESAISSKSGCNNVSITTDQNATTYKCTATSAGGTSSDQVTIKRDATAPVITATGNVTGTAGSNGWYKSAIDVEFRASDGLSGFSGKTDPYTFTQSSGNQQGSAVNVNSGSVSDKAGNVADAVNSGPFKVDYTAPALSPSVSPNPVLLNGSATASAGASDDHSGVASSSCDSVNTSSVGSGKSVSCSATDNAGNSANANASYSVQYKWEGFLQPINNTAHQTGTDISTFKFGSTVPVKFQLKDANGNVVQPASAPLWVTPAKGSATSQPVDEAVYSDPATTGTQYRWDSTAQQYIYNWSTKSASSGFYYRIGVQLDDGKTYYQNISLK